MISLSQIQKLTIDNSPLILTTIGVVGTIGTAVLTHKAATKTHRRLLAHEDSQMANLEPFAPMTRKEVVKATWTYYIPPVVSGGVTIGSIVMSNRIGSKRAAALAAAYAISDKAYNEYRDKIVEQLGMNEDRKARDSIAADRVRNNPEREGNVVVVGTGKVLCYDMYTDRYFESSVEEIKRSVNEVNHIINVVGHASVSDFYSQLDIPATSFSDEMGWDSNKLMDVTYTTVLSPDGRPCVAIDFGVKPVRDYWRF